jgi:membrane protein
MISTKPWKLFVTAIRAWRDDGAQSLGAALAYYTLFSIAPVLLIVISVAGLLFDEAAARSQIAVELQRLVGSDGAAVVITMLDSVNQPAQSLTATIVGITLVFIGATTVFGELQNALDRIWNVTQSDEKRIEVSYAVSLWALVRARILSFGMILGIGFILMVSLALSAGISALNHWWTPTFSHWTRFMEIADMAFSFVVITGLFAVIFKTLPRVHVRWDEVFIGAVITALLFSVGKWLIGIYIGKSAFSSVYGAAGSLLALLVWVYYSAQIFLFGAELTWAYAHIYGSRKGMP